MKTKPKILVIDDEAEMLTSTCKILNSSNYETFPLHDSRIMEMHLEANDYDLILCDLLMPNIDGKQVLEILKNNNIDIPVIIFSAYGTIDRAVTCMKAGAYDFIEKPFESDHLLLLVERALNYSKIFKERNELLSKLDNKFKFENIVGRSDSMMKIFGIIDNLIQSEANIIITGESGTGKELIARCIHEKSKRRHYNFVPVNCGALPDNLFEAELFGYERGAFTGAENQKIGLLEYATNGTFFLDEIGELPKNLQTKLLRVLQERKLRRLGGNKLIDVNIRLVSATNRNLEDLISKNILRDDLYYRVNVINIHIPPLRERKEDILLLTDHFLKKNVEKSSKQISGIDPQVIKIFEDYDWQGNVRELENVIERAVALTKENIILPNDLPPHLFRKESQKKSFDKISIKQVRESAVEEVDRQYLHYLLEKYNGNVSKIAENTDMTRRNTYYLLKRYNIKPEAFRKK